MSTRCVILLTVLCYCIQIQQTFWFLFLCLYLSFEIQHCDTCSLPAWFVKPFLISSILDAVPCLLSLPCMFSNDDSVYVICHIRMWLITLIQLITDAFTFPGSLCQTVLSDRGNTEQVWDEKRYLQVPFLLQQHSFYIELNLLTLCLVPHNQMLWNNMLRLSNALFIKKNLYVIEQDRKLFWQDQHSIKRCWLTLTELQLLIYCLLYIRISVKLCSL